MKPFNGPKRQGGWIALAAIVVGGIASSASEQKQSDKQGKRSYADQRDLSQLQFEQKRWLDEQARAWNLEDYARVQNYKEDAVRSFAGAAPANTLTADGSWGAPPARTTVDTSNLAQRNEDGSPLIRDPRTGQPMGQFG